MAAVAASGHLAYDAGLLCFS